MGREGKIGKLSEEMAALSAEADKLTKKSKALSDRVKEHGDIVERLGDTVTVAKGILKRFPSQKKVLEELEGIKEKEQALLEKNKSLEKILEAVGGRQVTAKQFTETIKKMDAKAAKVRRDMGSLEAALDDEKKLKGGEMQDIMKMAGEIRNKKRMLDDIKDSLDELVTISNNLSKRITLLSREAKLLEIRADVGAAAVPKEKKSKEIKHRLKLSEDEEMEFRKKREELKKLIRRLWEEES